MYILYNIDNFYFNNQEKYFSNAAFFREIEKKSFQTKQIDFNFQILTYIKKNVQGSASKSIFVGKFICNKSRITVSILFWQYCEVSLES